MGYFLDNWGSFIGAISLVVTVAGFALAIYRVGQAQKAAAAAEEASRETRAAITRVLTVVDLERAIALVERLKDFHRGGRWESSLALYPALKITLSDIRSRHPDPTPELRQQLDESILQINEMENKVDQTIGDGSEQLEHQAFNIILNSIESSLLDISYSIQSFQERDKVGEMADINSIVDKVLERSEQDRINWRPTVTANTFVASIGNLGVSISIPRSTVVDSIARFRVIDDRGQTIQDLSVDNIDNPHIHTKLMKIHSKARQIASNNDPRLEELLEELDRV